MPPFSSLPPPAVAPLQLHYRHDRAPLTSLDTGPLTGLRHRTVVDHRTGSRALALWQEEHLPSFHVPLHRHDCEEIISILAGEVEGHVGERSFRVAAGESFLIPAWEAHGFKVVSSTAVRLLAIFSSADPRIFRLDGTPTTPPWEGGASGHLAEPDRSHCTTPSQL
jgi:quercetin dioxygenase-like cupin family protein